MPSLCSHDIISTTPQLLLQEDPTRIWLLLKNEHATTTIRISNAPLCPNAESYFLLGNGTLEISKPRGGNPEFAWYVCAQAGAPAISAVRGYIDLVTPREG